MDIIVVKVKGTSTCYRVVEQKHMLTYISEPYDGLSVNRKNEFLMRGAEYDFLSVEKFILTDEKHLAGISIYEFESTNDADRFINWHEKQTEKATASYYNMRD